MTVVVGGGAAGMMAACTAAARGKSVTVLERNAKTCRKVCITGKVRCNLTNACSGDELLQQFPFLQLLPTQETGTAVYYGAPGFRGRVGLISPVSHQFCDRCSRVRLLADGTVKPCLAYDTVYDLKPYLPDEAALAAAVRDIILKKPAGHAFQSAPPQHGLNRTGG